MGIDGSARSGSEDIRPHDASAPSAAIESIKLLDEKTREDMAALTEFAARAVNSSFEAETADAAMPSSPPPLIGREELEYLYRCVARRRLDAAKEWVIAHVVNAPSAARRHASGRKLSDDAARWAGEKQQQEQQQRQQALDAGMGGGSHGGVCGVAGLGGGAGSDGDRKMDRDAMVKAAVLERFAEAPDDSRTTHRPMAAGPLREGSYGQSTCSGQEGRSGRRGNGSETTYRWLDGQRVKMSNGREKFVVEDLSKDWDGGSRGKVVTKSQRLNPRR